MKCILFDVDTSTLLSKDGWVRPFMDIILRFCKKNGVHVYLATSEKIPDKTKIVINFVQEHMGEAHSFTKGGPIPHQPTLVFGCDADYLKKWPASILIPPYVPERSNEFMELAFAGHLLDTIKNRVVLGRQAVVEKVEQPKPPEQQNKEDFSNWAFEV